MRVLVLSGPSGERLRVKLVRALRAAGLAVYDVREDDLNEPWRTIDPEFQEWDNTTYCEMAKKQTSRAAQEQWRRSHLAGEALRPNSGFSTLRDCTVLGLSDAGVPLATMADARYARAVESSDAVVLVGAGDRSGVHSLGRLIGHCEAGGSVTRSAWVLLDGRASATPVLGVHWPCASGSASQGVTTDVNEVVRRLCADARDLEMARYSSSPRVGFAERWPAIFDDQLQFNSGWNDQNYDGQRADPDAPACWATPLVWATQVRSADGQAGGRLTNMRTWLRDVRRSQLHCRYVSATTIVRDYPRWTPAPMASYEMMRGWELPDTWAGDELRHYWDVRSAEGRRVWIQDVVRTTLVGDWDAISIDNISRGQNLGLSVDRDEYDAGQLALMSELYEELGRGAHALRMIVNVAANGTERLLDFTDVADGLLYELPIHPNVIGGGRGAIAEELTVYSMILARGLLLGLVPIASSGMTTQQKVTQQRMTAAAAMLVWKPGDALCVSMSDAAPTTYDWFGWKRVLGWPLGGTSGAGLVFVREFTGGTLTVDFGAMTAEVTT